MDVFDGPGTEVTEVTRDTVQLGDGRTLPGVITVWAAGFGVPDLARRSGLRTDHAVHIEKDRKLFLIGVRNEKVSHVLPP